MFSAVIRKSVTDLTRRKARAFFTVLTLALAIASVGVFAVPALMQQAMDREVAANRLADVTLTMKPLRLSAAELAALGRLPNVAAVEPRTIFTTRVYVGDKRDEAAWSACPTSARSRPTSSGRLGRRRAPGSLLVEEANVDKGDFTGRGEDRHRRRHDARAAGQRPGPHPRRVLRMGLHDVLRARRRPSPRSPARTATRRSRCASTTPAAPRRSAPWQRCASTCGPRRRSRSSATSRSSASRGAIPGKADFESMASLLNVVTLLALLSALVLLSNTMTTLVGEQTSEIASMKAIGARRRDVRRIYLRTARCSASSARSLGVGLGIVISNLLVGFFAGLFFGIDAGFGVVGPVRGREPAPRARRPAAGGAARGAPRGADAAQRGAAGDRLARRRPRPARRAAAPRGPPAAVGADRAARGRPPQAPHRRHGAPGRARGRHVPRVPLGRRRVSRVHARVVRRQPLRRVGAAAGRRGARRRTRRARSSASTASPASSRG